MSDQEALKELEDGIIRELEAAIEERLDDASTFLIEIQPPTSIVHAAAVAAAQVLMAFERGYRMDDGDQRTPTTTLPTDHKARHVVLNQFFDELLADFIGHTGKVPSGTTVMEFINWSYEQTINPTPQPPTESVTP